MHLNSRFLNIIISFCIFLHLNRALFLRLLVCMALKSYSRMDIHYYCRRVRATILKKVKGLCPYRTNTQDSKIFKENLACPCNDMHYILILRSLCFVGDANKIKHYSQREARRPRSHRVVFFCSTVMARLGLEILGSREQQQGNSVALDSQTRRSEFQYFTRDRDFSLFSLSFQMLYNFLYSVRQLS